jgi:3-dehydroquinate synthase
MVADMPEVKVDLQERSYRVVVKRGVLNDAGSCIAQLNLASRFAIITDHHVACHHLDPVRQACESAGLNTSTHVLPAGEASKSFEQLARLCSELAEAGHDRSSAVVALGGGVVGDLAGFVAASFYRGIPLIQIPTTIVAQVDSSVGGKTGINLPQGKNLVGAFHQPRLVLIDPATLETLPGREFREGFAEVIKHAAIREPSMLEELARLDPQSQTVPDDLIARNIAIKARIVEEDEHETAGTRALLNFGHTIGHGIEAAVPYGELLHGEAISLGLRAALFLSERHTGLDGQHADRVIRILHHFQLPTHLDEAIPTTAILDRVARDKKFDSGRIRFVLLKALGDAVVSKAVTSRGLQEAIDHLRMPPTPSHPHRP